MVAVFIGFHFQFSYKGQVLGDLLIIESSSSEEGPCKLSGACLSLLNVFLGVCCRDRHAAQRFAAKALLAFLRRRLCLRGGGVSRVRMVFIQCRAGKTVDSSVLDREGFGFFISVCWWCGLIR